ncbi:MAG: ATP-binding protein, partial [Mycobacterium sp.]
MTTATPVDQLPLIDALPVEHLFDMHVNLQPVILPIELVADSQDCVVASSRDTDCTRFLNRAAEVFEVLPTAGFQIFSGDLRDFWRILAELYKNIYDHSNSWGLVTVVARPQYGTVISFHDLGIGILKSVESLGARSLTSDEQAIRWALIEGNSSKVGNSGLGLALVSRFVSTCVGQFEIRSGNCRL